MSDRQTNTGPLATHIRIGGGSVVDYALWTGGVGAVWAVRALGRRAALAGRRLVSDPRRAARRVGGGG